MAYSNVMWNRSGLFFLTAILGCAFMMSWAIAAAVLIRVEQAQKACLLTKPVAQCRATPAWESTLRRAVFALGND